MRSCLFRTKHFWQFVVSLKSKNMALLYEGESSFISMASFQINEDISCHDLVEMLNKIVSILKTETNNAVKIEDQLQSKCELYNKVTDGLTYKLNALRGLARGVDREKIETFVDQISASWVLANIQVSRAHSKIQLASQVSPGVPLSLLLKRLRKEATAANVALQIGQVIYSDDYVSKGYHLCDEVAELARNLERYDVKVQQYLAMSKLIPYLKKLLHRLDKFASSTALLRPGNAQSANLSVLPVLSQLLTGELLGHKPINASSVLLDNAPRKPILITQYKRRWGTPDRGWLRK